ncbi:hypothetical protein MMC17_001379 [Xylographa soralifera]|nr:hypothetical protein [Xylographa soralifera]
MAEIIGLMASVIAVIQLAEAVDKTVSKYLHTTRSVQSVLVPLLGKLRHLNAILSTLQVQLNTTKSSALQHLHEPLRICEALLTKLKARLDHLQIIAGCVIGPVLDKDSLKHLKRLDDLIPVLQLALDADTLASTHAIEDYLQSLRLESLEQAQIIHHDIQAHHKDIRKWKEEEDRQREMAAESQLRERIFNWLTVVNPEENYLAACQRSQPGTGNWLLDSLDFSDWESGRDNYLWLNAIAGAGKTILSSTIIQHLKAKYDDTCVAYYFFDFKDNAKQDVKGLLASLLTQTVGTFKSLPKPLLELFQRHKLRNPERPTPPTIDELMGALIEVISLRSTIYIVIDALDECKQTGLLLETLCTIFSQLRSNCRLLCTSRAENEIQRVFQKQSIKNLQIQSAAVDHDVAVYVRAVLETDDRLRAYRQGIKDLIATTLTNGAQGMFRWVQCQVDHIRTLRTANDVKHALERLPPNLDQTYDHILLSVQPEDRELLRKALQLVVFSARPMQMREVAEAVIIEPGTSKIDEDDRLQRPEDLLDIGKSLFVQNHTKYPVAHFLELAHYSVKEYLLSERIKKGQAAAFAIEKTRAELNNATCLLTYLGLEVFEDTWHAFDAKTWELADIRGIHLDIDFLTRQHEQRLEEYPLLFYAAQHCFRHHCKTEAVQHMVSSLIRNLFSAPRSGRFQNMTYTCVYNPLDPVASYARLFKYSLVSIAAQFNLSIIVQDMLVAGMHADYLSPKPNLIESFPEGQTALYRAADFGYTDLCKILIDAGANVQGTTSYDCPLSAAARGGKTAILRMMLDAGADVVKDARPLCETQLVIWWRYVEEKNNSKWRDILDILRDAGGKWSTIGLLAAFSKSTKPLVKYAAEVLQDDSIANTRTQSDQFKCIADEIDTNTLSALQWLAQDEAGTTGLKASLEMMLHAAYESQPLLFIPNARFATQKFNAEEMVAENLIHFYFRLAPNVLEDSALHTITQQPDTLLNALWDNRSHVTQATAFTAGITRVPTQAGNLMENVLHSGAAARAWDVKDLIVCGEILRAWTRARWEDSYVPYLD